MYADLSSGIEINDRPKPKYNEYINNEYELREEARQILKSRLVDAGIRFARSHEVREFEEFYRYVSINIPKESEPSYESQSIEDAEELITEYFIDEIVTALIESGEASSDINNDYDNGDGIFHENIVDRSYRRDDAIQMLDELYRDEEEDSGIWEGLDWEETLQAKAAYTYGNAVWREFGDIIDTINNDVDIHEIELNTMNEILDEIDDSIMEHDGVDLSNEEAILDWAKENKESWNETLEKNVKVAVNELLA